MHKMRKNQAINSSHRTNNSRQINRKHPISSSFYLSITNRPINSNHQMNRRMLMINAYL